MSFTLSQENDIKEINENLRKLISGACDDLRDTLKQFREEDTYDKKIIDEFHISNHLFGEISKIPVFNNITDTNVAIAIESEKLEELSDKLTIFQLEKYLKSFTDLQTSLNEYNNFLKKELKKYNLDYLKESENTNEDLLELTTLQTNAFKLQADIHQANEQQDQKKIVINKLAECFEIYNKINERLAEKIKLADSLKDLRHLPPNLQEAEKKLNELKKKFKEVCEKFSKEVTIKV